MLELLCVSGAEVEDQEVTLLPDLNTLWPHDLYLVLELAFDKWLNILASLEGFDAKLILLGRSA